LGLVFDSDARHDQVTAPTPDPNNAQAIDEQSTDPMDAPPNNQDTQP
jgi:hypothetical protein